MDRRNKTSIEKDTRISYGENLHFYRFSMRISFRQHTERYVKDRHRNQSYKVPRIPGSPLALDELRRLLPGKLV